VRESKLSQRERKFVPSLGDGQSPPKTAKTWKAGSTPVRALNIYALNLDDHELPSAYLYKSNGTWKYTLRPDAL
jgi:hypothetical protein